MCQAIDEMLKDSREEGEAIGWKMGEAVGREEGKKSIITAMYKSGMTLQQIAGIVGQSPEYVENLLV